MRPVHERARVIASSLLLYAVILVQAQSSPPSALFSAASLDKCKTLAQSTSAPVAWPEYTNTSEQWMLMSEDIWTAAFFPSTLYSVHHRLTDLCPDDNDDNATDWLALARTWSAGLYNPSESVLTAWAHDVGFNTEPAEAELLLDPSNETAQANILRNADALASRYSSVVGCTRSWDRGSDDFEVIIDNMMNLPLLLTAADLTGNATYRDMAMSHANKTRENHIRADGSSYHVVDYSPTTGGVQWRGTSQGYSNSSTWTRGQAWGTLGFALMYNATGVHDYFDTSRQMAAYFLANLPSSGVSPWDFSAPEPTTLDSSASLIESSALLLLSSLEASQGNSTGAEYWASAAKQLLSDVVSVAVDSWSGASIVGNATVNNREDPPNNNTGAIYGDAYFIQSGNYLLSLGLANCSSGTPAVGASPSALSSALVTIESGAGTTNGSSSTGASGTRATTAGAAEGDSNAVGRVRPPRAFELVAGLASGWRWWTRV